MTKRIFVQLCSLLMAAFAQPAAADEWTRTVKEGVKQDILNRGVQVNIPLLGSFAGHIGAFTQSVFGVVNATGTAARGTFADRIFIRVLVQQKEVAVLAPGEDWKIYFGGGHFRWLYYGSYWYYSNASDTLLVTTEACTSVTPVTAVNFPPQWATDPNFAGQDALTAEYLISNPSERELRKRVGEIKKLLRRRHQLGLREKERDLDAWVKYVTRYQIANDRIRCESPVPVGNTVTIDRSVFNGVQPYVLFVRGTWPSLGQSWNR